VARVAGHPGPGTRDPAGRCVGRHLNGGTG
jgi:hypothetical protein